MQSLLFTQPMMLLSKSKAAALNVCAKVTVKLSKFTVPRGPEVNVDTITFKVKLKEVLLIICIYFSHEVLYYEYLQAK